MRRDHLRAFGKRVLRRHLMGALPSGVVLIYHRVADLETDPQLLAVSPRNFADHLGVLGQSYIPVRLGTLRDHLHVSSRHRHPVALTFDDGYADNLRHGLPLLQAAGIPATAFIVAGQIDSAGEFWWDELDRIFLQASILPERLELTIASKEYSWHLPRPTDACDRRWHVLSEQPCSPHQAAYKELCELLRPLSTPERERVLDSIRGWAGLDAEGRAHNRALTTDELVTLAEDGLVEVGAHTMTHPVLSEQPLAVQREEIEASKHRLEGMLSREVRSFSYPYGGRSYYSPATVRLVREAGFGLACSDLPHKVYWATDRYQIPRRIVRDWSGDEFARRLNAFFHE